LIFKATNLRTMKKDVLVSGKLLICDDHILFCEGLKGVIHTIFPSLEILISNDVANAIEVIEKNELRTLICDINIKGQNGIDLIKSFRSKLEGCIIVVLSGYFDYYMINKAKNAGADYFLKKEVSTAELFMAIVGKHPDKLKDWGKNHLQEDQTLLLSKQEREIVKLVSEGLMSKEIAEKLFISKTTVDTHRRNIHRKLNTTTTTEIIKMVYEGRLKF
jgi:two-component system nitrate/nitrite response regulator NarL